jgi:hypothetical protein
VNFSRLGVVSAGVASLALAGCTTGTHQVSTSAGSTQAGLAAQRRIADTVAHHGREVEHGTSVMISEGNHHMVFPGNALIVRNGDGITVTVNGAVTRFSKNAKVDRSGVYHKYAAQ